jgi:hypothetical protein
MDLRLAAKPFRWWLLFQFGMMGLGVIALEIAAYAGLGARITIPGGAAGLLLMIFAFPLVNAVACLAIAMRTLWAAGIAMLACLFTFSRYVFYGMYTRRFDGTHLFYATLLGIEMILMLSPMIKTELRTKTRVT